jgi:hypothetical protein
MITFDSGGGLGNRIFQYVSARLLAEKLGYSLNTDCPVRNVLTPTDTMPGKVYKNDMLHTIETLDTGNIFKKEWGKRHLHFQGYWQDPNYYISERKKIVDYFEEKATESPDKENIVMHVRLGDYKTYGPGGTVLNNKYYFDCLKREKFKRIFIVTDSPDDEYLLAFEKFNPIIMRGHKKSDFWFLTEFDRIIIANSSFSWWAAFLSNATKIYTPKCWIRNSTDIRHELQNINNGKCEGIQMDAGFLDYD